MSRKQWRLSDFDKYLKPMHLAGKQQVLTITHIGVEPIKTRRREFTIAGEAPEESEDDLLLVLHFREYPKPLRVNNLNRAKLREIIGDDPAVLIGCRVTLRPITLKQFGGQEAVDIVSVERPKANGAQQPLIVEAEGDRIARVRKLSDLRQKEKELLSSKGLEPTPLTAEDVKAMSDEDLAKRIELTESNILNLKSY